MVRWSRSFGAVAREDGVYFRVWAPEAQSVEAVIESQNRTLELVRQDDGTWNGFTTGATAGDLYRYRLNSTEAYPDPASSYQPSGVHGPSMVVDPLRFRWNDDTWIGIDSKDLVIYELHPGTFSGGGNFTGIKDRLQYLANLGITAIELMPLADFPGRWNWGYDGVDLFAPARCYGTPDDLRDLIDTAHQHGLAVIIDVVYNHFGPDGAYWHLFSKQYFSDKHHTPWGDAINFDGPGSRMVREFFIENAMCWINEFHADGLRMDATHSIRDDSREHFCAELARRVYETTLGRKVHLIAEDHRNLATLIRPAKQNGWGLSAMWSDDFHHILRRILRGDSDGYFIDYRASLDDLALALQQGWLFSGQYSQYFREPRGSEPQGISQDQLVIFLQNHDQIGNRPLGLRLNQEIDRELYHAVSVLLLCAPQIPMLFMGQEWGANTPFCYFTDHDQELGMLVTKGRMDEFSRFKGFSDTESRKSIPDPQSEKTFEASRLQWSEIEQQPHAQTLSLYKELLGLRKHIVTTSHNVTVQNQGTISIRYALHTVLVHLSSQQASLKFPDGRKHVLWSTGQISVDPKAIRFTGPGAAILNAD